ncbi:MAG: hypothetical protein IKJ27_00250 [Clostridia bacterium]|nr:hypothetical protein [Clostridia bacterium]
MIAIKRGTTPNIIIEIEDVNMDDITEVHFAFKAIDDETAPLLFPEKEYVKSKNPESFYKVNDEKFEVNIKLKEKETFKIPKGYFYVDVLPIAGEERLDTGKPLKMESFGTYFKEVE